MTAAVKTASEQWRCDEARVVPELVSESLRSRTHHTSEDYAVSGCDRSEVVHCVVTTTDEDEWACAPRDSVRAEELDRAPLRPRVLARASKKGPSRPSKIDLDIGATLQGGADPPAGLLSAPKANCNPCAASSSTFAMYGVGLGARMGVAVNIPAAEVVARPYAALRWEHFFESDWARSGQVNHLAVELGFGLRVWRVEMGPSFGVGTFAVSNGASEGPVVDVGGFVTFQLIAGLTLGVFFHYNFAAPFTVDVVPDASMIETLNAPVFGGVVSYRFKLY